MLKLLCNNTMFKNTIYTWNSVTFYTKSRLNKIEQYITWLNYGAIIIIHIVGLVILWKDIENSRTLYIGNISN